MELWTMRTPEAGTVEHQAARAEAAGWDGITFTDSQNLVGDPFVAIALAARATERLRFATGVTNVSTRHPAALASVAAHRAGGVGRPLRARHRPGRHRPVPPRPQAHAGRRIRRRRRPTCRPTSPAAPSTATGTRAGCSGSTGRRQPKVPLDIAPRARRSSTSRPAPPSASRSPSAPTPTGSPGRSTSPGKAAADAGRDPAAISFGAYVNVGCHPDLDAARALIAGGVAAFAHFSAMPGSTGAGLAEADRAVVAEVGRRYDSNRPPAQHAEHTGALDRDFVDRFAVVGPPDAASSGCRRWPASGSSASWSPAASFGADRDDARTAERLLTTEVLPALRAEAPRRRPTARGGALP